MCRELWAFAQQNKDALQATYLLAGYKSIAVERQTQDAMDTDTDEKTVANVLSETVPAQIFELVQEKDLEGKQISNLAG